jgi:hypothetical protein
MATQVHAEALHRLVKQAIDSGAADSVAAAQSMFEGYRLCVEIDEAAATDPTQQAILLSTVALGRRVFLGGVSVSGILDLAHATPMPLGSSLRAAVEALGGLIDAEGTGAPTIVIGPAGARREGFAVRAVAAGWRAGILPVHSELRAQPGPTMPLAAVTAAALAVNEAFLHVNASSPVAGRRALGLSLWRPKAEVDWLEADATEPTLAYLPSRLWLIGLGHLGQAYLWALGLLPYCAPGEVSLVLQDIDEITPSTESTSVLSNSSLVGVKKTRAMAAWAELRGFQTTIYERLFDASLRRQAAEPGIALCGLDNAVGRRALDQVGFALVIEAGLGSGHRDFRTMRLHTLPGSRPTAEMWKTRVPVASVEEQPAYARLLAEGSLDRCGMTLLAGKAVGAPFVGAFASALALSEVLRLLHGGPVHQLIEVDLLSLDQRVVLTHCRDFNWLNPGFTACAALST